MGMGFAMANQMGQALNQSGSGQAMGNQQGATPPPLSQSIKYYAALGGKQSGPFDMAMLQQYIQSCQLTKQTLVWREGMQNWIPPSRSQS